MATRFRSIYIIGVGQIGASLGIALTQARASSRIIGIGRRLSNLKIARRLGAISTYRSIRQPRDIQKIPFHKEDLVILATPVSSIRECLRHLSKNPLIIDVGSTKEGIVREAERLKLRFVGTHPIAGTEKGGAAAGNPELFLGRRCLITPARSCPRSDVEKVEQLWRELGARVTRIGSKEHDRLLSSLSHLPHAAAYTLMATVARLAGLPAMAQYSLGGLRDTTRIAASPPEMWTDIFLENRAISKGLDRYQREMARLATMIRNKKRRSLLRWLTAAQKLRARL